MPKSTNTVPSIRCAFNEVIPNALYQRGQILTWAREKKYELLRTLGVRTVVNFWPKIDCDMAETPIDNYLLFWAPRSEQMLEDRIAKAGAELVARLVEEGSPALILCEAGVTRSVFFSVLVAARVWGTSPGVALERLTVSGALSTRGLRGFMRDWIEAQ